MNGDPALSGSDRKFIGVAVCGQAPRFRSPAVRGEAAGLWKAVDPGFAVVLVNHREARIRRNPSGSRGPGELTELPAKLLEAGLSVLLEWSL
jgi:hypothetical protein